MSANNQSVEPRTISHTGGELGSDAVTLSQNQVDPQRPTPILEWTCPRKYESVRYVGRRDPTRFVPRTMESFDGSTGDDTVHEVDAVLQPIAGETDLEDQDYPVVVAVNVASGDEIEVVDIDYGTNEVTLGTDPADGETVKLYPILTEGSIKFQGRNQLGQREGTLYPYGTPPYIWHDMAQYQEGREVNLHGNARWGRQETLEVLLDSPQQIIWEDDDYPLGGYVSRLEQDVRIEL